MMRTRRLLCPRSARHSLRIPCQVVRLWDFRLIAASIENVSLGGALTGPSEPVLTGEQLIVSFQLPVSGKWLDVDATVARVIHGRRKDDPVRAMGIQFDGLSDRLRSALQTQLSVVPPTPPQTRPGRRNFESQLQSLAIQSGWVRSSQGHYLPRWWPR